MKARVLRPVITLTTVMGILLAVLAVYALTAGAAHADSTFHPSTIVKFCNDIESPFPPDTTLNGGAGACSEAAGLGAGAHPTVTSTLDIPAGDLNFSNIVTLAPNSQTIAAGTSMPAGEKIGALHSDTSLGTFNGACNFFIPVDFRLFNVALPDNTTDPRASTNITYPRADGESNRFGRWGAPNAGPPSVGPDNIIEGSPTGYALGTNNAIQGYPSFLLDLFDKDFVPGVGDTSNTVGNRPLVPRAVYGGMTKVVGDWIPLFLAQFDSGALTALTNSPLKLVTANMGQPQVAVLNDPYAGTSVSNISDFCSDLGTTTMLLGTSSPSSVDRVTNPGAGTTQFYLQYFASQRDTDQDGFENQFDACPLTVNTGDGRAASGPGNGDSDTDGIDNACDGVSDPGVSDTDSDGYKNRQDNCPQVSNGATPAPTGTPAPADLFQKESELSSGVGADNGPVSDGIGDLCDSEGGTLSVTQNGQTVSIPMSDTVSNGRYMSATNVVAKCIGGTDADLDGYCSGADTFDTAGGHNAARHTSWSGATHPALQMDTDLDGRSDAQETWMSQCTGSVGTPSTVTRCSVPLPNAGSDTVHSCAQSIPTANNEGPMDNWGFDYNDDGKASGNDLLNFAVPFGKTVDVGAVTVSGMGTLGIYRFDINNDGIVSGNDLLALAPVFGKTCAQAGVPAFSQQ